MSWLLSEVLPEAGPLAGALRHADPVAGMDERVAATRAPFLAAVDGIATPLHEPAAELFDTIATPNWALEWGLADWIGGAFGVEETTVAALRLSNAYLIAFARLTDDLADGDSTLPPEVAVPLSVTLHHLWLGSYVRLLDGSPHEDRFWTSFDRDLGRWMRATAAGPDAAGPLADRAAFLDVGLTAACLVAGRDDALEELGSALHDLAVGIVMLDDLFDWRADLDHGRPNALVGHVWPGRIDAAGRPAIARAVKAELYGDGARSYVDALLARLDEAYCHACAGGCLGLAAFVEWYATEVAACGAHTVERALAARAVFEDLGGEPPPRCQGTPARR